MYMHYITKMRLSKYPLQPKLLLVPVTAEEFRWMLLPEQGHWCQVYEAQSCSSPPGLRLQHAKSSLCPLLREYMAPDSRCCYTQDYTGYPCLQLWWLFFHVRILYIERETGKGLGLACFLHSIGSAANCMVFDWTAVHASWFPASITSSSVLSTVCNIFIPYDIKARCMRELRLNEG